MNLTANILTTEYNNINQNNDKGKDFLFAFYRMFNLNNRFGKSSTSEVFVFFFINFEDKDWDLNVITILNQFNSFHLKY